jgi:zinc transport system permease protein
MMSLLDDFLVRATLAGLGVALAAAPLGCFIVWRRMAFFGDATAHAAILGVALALAFNLSIVTGTAVLALAMALAVTALSGRAQAVDTLLGVLSHSALAAGLVAVSLLQGVRVDLSAYLFGEILGVDRMDLAIIWCGAALVSILLWARWSALLTATVSPDLAYAAGLDPRREQLILTVALAITVAVAIQVVGALLIGALLIIPAAAARAFSRTPEGMAAWAALIGATSALAGMAFAYRLDTPAGPTIVCVAAGIFAVASMVRLARDAA